jgi:hypothetical protein
MGETELISLDKMKEKAVKNEGDSSFLTLCVIIRNDNSLYFIALKYYVSNVFWIKR